jgi:hypothetical protein
VSLFDFEVQGDGGRAACRLWANRKNITIAVGKSDAGEWHVVDLTPEQASALSSALAHLAEDVA